MSERYTDPCYGIKHQHVFPHRIVTGPVAATGVRIKAATTISNRNTFRMPFKARLNKIGIIMSRATRITCSSWGGFALRLAGVQGTALATFCPGTAAHYAPGYSTAIGTGTGHGWFCGSGNATSIAPETATYIQKDGVVEMGFIAGAAKGVIGTSHVVPFMEYTRVYDGGN